MNEQTDGWRDDGWKTDEWMKNRWTTDEKQTDGQMDERRMHGQETKTENRDGQRETMVKRMERWVDGMDG